MDPTIEVNEEVSVEVYEEVNIQITDNVSEHGSKWLCCICGKKNSTHAVHCRDCGHYTINCLDCFTY
jgi:hypothetical protein